MSGPNPATKIDIDRVATKVDQVVTTLDDVQHKTKQLQKSADIKADDWDLLTDVKGEVVKTQGKITELIDYLDQFRRDIKEEIRVSEDRVKAEMHALLDKKSVIRVKTPSWWRSVLARVRK